MKITDIGNIESCNGSMEPPEDNTFEDEQKHIKEYGKEKEDDTE